MGIDRKSSQPEDSHTQIKAYEIGGVKLEIRPAPRTRKWMDETNQHYAYRCLPLVIANQYGFELLAPEEVEIFYGEGSEMDAITFKPKPIWATSHFGYGIVTFVIPYLFRTPPGIHLYVCGPANNPKNKLAPLEGVVETDHAIQTFTANWKFTSYHAGALFRKGEPICRIFPVLSEAAICAPPEIVPHDKVPKEVMDGHREWNNSRGEFLKGLKEMDPKYVKAGWQKDYIKAAKVKCPRSSS